MNVPVKLSEPYSFAFASKTSHARAHIRRHDGRWTLCGREVTEAALATQKSESHVCSACIKQADREA